MKILVAADGSEYTKRMLGYLAAHDEWLGERHEYTVVHAVPPVPPRPASVLDKSVIDGYYHDEAEAVLEPIRAFFNQRGLKATFLHPVGPAAEVIVQAAEQGRHDLVMLGSHGHGSLVNLLLGSVATKVVAGTKVPVLLVR
ncbi:MAG: universal stress protein [Rubrivivax sp.]|nr:universal stress protein [Rubrivivax sp.]